MDARGAFFSPAGTPGEGKSRHTHSDASQHEIGIP